MSAFENVKLTVALSLSLFGATVALAQEGDLPTPKPNETVTPGDRANAASPVVEDAASTVTSEASAADDPQQTANDDNSTAAESTRNETQTKSPNAIERAAREGRAFIGHVPMGTVEASMARLPFEVRGEDLAGTIVVYFRPINEPSAPFQTVIAARDDSGHAAVIGTAQARAPGVAYYAVERMPNGEERPIFASREKPHPLQIYYDSETAREEQLLALAHGHRSRVNARVEWVDLGGFDAAPPGAADDERDRYYHIEAQYAYRFFRTVEELEFALGFLRGDVLNQNDLSQRRELGLNYGRAALTLALGNWVRLRPGLVLGISELGFEGGFDGAFIIGQRDGTAFELKGGFTSHVGGSFGARLGWATVPRVPMGALVEITNFPTNDDMGVRMLFDVGYELSDAALVRIWGGYRGRTSLAGGPAVGVETIYAF